MRVLDLGCGSGRILRTLATRSVRVCACDLNYAALVQLRASQSTENLIGIAQADARSLPFASASIDAVIFAFNGIDFLYPESERVTALHEIGRVLRPGGYFIVSTHNPVGTLLSPRGLRSPKAWRWRFRYALSGTVRQPYFRNHDGLHLYHALPTQVVAQVTEHTGTTFLYCLNRSGASRSVAVATLFSPWPYYAFRRRGGHAGS
jgi:ubiquinone/menaquinone biosynthesis C-methylase UbiE